MRLSLPIVVAAGTAAVASITPTIRWYSLSESFVGDQFLDGFEHDNFPDPTHGRVNYVDECTAIEKNLTFTSNDTFVMRADYTTVLDPNGPGRDSVRISSYKAYGYSIMILDLRHMPTGCGTWPAFWTNANNASWPEGGEIDILEGVNDEGPNGSVLHTSTQCTMVDTNMDDRGSIVSSNCTSAEGAGAGCMVHSDRPNSYGPGLNAIGGGFFAMERTASYINVWFWGRNETDIPDDIQNLDNRTTINAGAWGQPYANFVNNDCDIEKSFQDQNIIINLTLCGDWAGDAYPSTCPQTCVDHVNSNPADFENAYWDIASLRIYEPTANGPAGSKRNHHGRHHGKNRVTSF